MTDQARLYDRMMLRSAFQSLFWVVLRSRKREKGLTRKGLADLLGVHKSFVSRAFSRPPNWQIDKVSDMSDALGVDLIIEARDRATGVIYTPSGVRRPGFTSSSIEDVLRAGTASPVTTTVKPPADRPSLVPLAGSQVA